MLVLLLARRSGSGCRGRRGCRGHRVLLARLLQLAQQGEAGRHAHCLRLLLRRLLVLVLGKHCGGKRVRRHANGYHFGLQFGLSARWALHFIKAQQCRLHKPHHTTLPLTASNRVVWVVQAAAGGGAQWGGAVQPGASTHATTQVTMQAAQPARHLWRKARRRRQLMLLWQWLVLWLCLLVLWLQLVLRRRLLVLRLLQWLVGRRHALLLQQQLLLLLLLLLLQLELLLLMQQGCLLLLLLLLLLGGCFVAAGHRDMGGGEHLKHRWQWTADVSETGSHGPSGMMPTRLPASLAAEHAPATP